MIDEDWKKMIENQIKSIHIMIKNLANDMQNIDKRDKSGYCERCDENKENLSDHLEWHIELEKTKKKDTIIEEGN